MGRPKGRLFHLAGYLEAERDSRDASRRAQPLGRCGLPALNAIDGITAVKPKAAFYIFPKMDVKKFNITDDEQFALDLLHEKKILITRGGGFNWEKPDHFRIVYLPRMGVLHEAMEDLADFLAHYRQR